MFFDTQLPPDLRAMKQDIEGYARDYGLDFFETIFEVVDAEELNEIAAYGGFPTRYPHWSYGMAYEELKKGYDYGLSKIYELVINNDPCYAYLMRSNLPVDQKLVMAHVYGHCDFFKNNAYFGHTNRKMMDEIANHASRIRKYVERYGEDDVEAFIDRCRSIDDLIDIHSTAIKRRGESGRYDFSESEEDPIKVTRFKSKDYMKDYINPPKALRDEEEAQRKEIEQAERRFPDQPEKDVLLFLIEHAPLKPWQRDVLSILRDEAYYFMPQGQTKIMNEGWACLKAGSLVVTDAGLVPIEEIVRGRQSVTVSDGDSPRRVTDHAEFTDRESVAVRTRLGLELEGSVTHQLLCEDGVWRRLDQLQVGQRVKLGIGSDMWPTALVTIGHRPSEAMTLNDVAASAGVDLSTVKRYRNGRPPRSAPVLAPPCEEYDRLMTAGRVTLKRRRPVNLPSAVDEDLAAILGYLAGDGHISDVKRVIGLTTCDREQAERFADLAEAVFGITPRTKLDGNRYRVLFSSLAVRDFLVELGLKAGRSARIKCVPECVLRSPAGVVAAFLRALFDCDGCAGPSGVTLSTASEEMGKQVQLLLMNFGVRAARKPQGDGCWHVRAAGRSAKVFFDRIGFGLSRKRGRLREYVESRQWFKAEPEFDEVVSLERGRTDVYDITVEETHRYVAQGVVNHNSYWHSTIMTSKVLDPSEVIDYADHHSGTMAMSGGRLNPYKLGIELLRDIEHRWDTGKFGLEYDDCDDMARKKSWDRQLGLGRQKIFEVRRIHNDITFIDTFLTPEFCVQHNLFSFAYQEHMGQYVIESRDFDLIKQRLLFSLTNFGKPWIYAVDGNFRNRGELLLKHEYNGVDLKLDHAAETLVNVQFIWDRPVHLETVVEDKRTLLSYDGADHYSKVIGDAHESRRHPSRKSR